MKRVILDLEANGLTPDKMWCAVAKDIDTGEIFEFDKTWKDYRSLRLFSKDVSQWAGHYFLGYDLKVLRDLADIDINPADVTDTLVVSRLVNFTRKGGHGLESYGEECGILKPEQEQWDVYEDKMLHRCRQDVLINEYVLQKYSKYLDSDRWRIPLKIEHSTADYCRRLQENGFPFNYEGGKKLFEGWTAEKAEIEANLQKAFPPRYREIRQISPVLTKSGKLHSKDFRWYEGDPNETYSAGAPFSLVERIAFDPASKQQCIDRLHDAGWRPTNKTDGYKDYLRKPKRERDPKRLDHFEKYGWKLDTQNLETLPKTAPAAAKTLVRWLELNGKLAQVNQWLELYNEKTGRIHGRFMSIGAWSGRCAHSAPNMANASSDHDVRALWTSTPDTVLVGCDAEGIQLRVLAHYMNDDRFTAAVQGDPHTLNAQALGHVAMRWEGHPDPKRAPRQVAKKFIYSWLLGAQAGKLGEDMECTTKEAREAMENFVRFYPGLKSLKEEQIPADALRGYFEGLDGRYVKQHEERLILAGYLQNGESVLMKLARMLWEDDLRREKIWYQPVNFVHDEWQTLFRPDEAEVGGTYQAASIKRAGEILKVRCPMAGKAIVGRTWDQTH